MRRVLYAGLLAGLTLFGPGPAPAQETAQETADKGFLTEFIQDNLSGAGRFVSIDGFAGALSTRASIDRMTIADSQGVWLTLDDVTLEWTRSALLAGRIEVAELSAGLIVLDRLPVTDPNIPTPEAQGFSLPDLPVSVNIGTLRADRITLGETILGQPLAFGITGSMALSGGEGTATVAAERLDSERGVFSINAAYSNTTRVLGLTLDLDEDAGGIASTLLNLPGAPSVRMSINGTGPISDYAADISIATDGAERLTGQVQVQNVPPPEGSAPDAKPESRYALTARGDVTPLFAPQYRDFFGTDVALNIAGGRSPEGVLALRTFTIETRALQLDGTVSLSPEGWPRAFELTGTMADPSGGPLVLPLTGPRTEVSRARMDLRFDRDAGDAWTLSMRMDDFARPGLSLATVDIAGGGTIQNGEGGTLGAITAAVDYTASGLQLADDGLAEALGGTIGGALRLRYDEGTGTTIETLTLDGPGIAIVADGTATLDADAAIIVTSTVRLTAGRMARFATLTGLPGLGGGADLRIQSTVLPVLGEFDAVVSGGTTDLTTGIARLDPLLAGNSTVALGLARSKDGLTLSDLRIAATHVRIEGNATLTSGASQARLVLDLTDIGLTEPRLRGPFKLDINAGRDALGEVSGFAAATLAGDVATLAATRPKETDGDSPDIDLRLTANLRDLGRYADMAGRQLGGAVVLAAQGATQPDGKRFDLALTGTTVSPVTGIAELDGLLVGNGIFRAQATRDGDTYAVSGIDVATPTLTLTGDAAYGPNATRGTVSALVTDLGVIRAGLSGPATVEGAGDMGPDGAITGTVAVTASGDRANLTVTRPQNTAPLTLDGAATVANLSRYAAVTGQTLRGGITARIAGTGQPDASAFDLTLQGTTQSAGIGNATLDKLLAGAGRFGVRAIRPDGGGLTLEGINVTTPNLTLSGSLSGQDGAGSAQFDARLADIGLFTPDFSGPATATGTAQRMAGGDWVLNTVANGPGGTTATASGAISPTGQLAVNVTGSAPLGLLNGALEPRRLEGVAAFDLAVNGPATLDSVQGTVRLDNARLSAPTLGQALEGISGTIGLNNGQAQVALAGTVTSGGTITVSGPVTLSAPYQAGLSATLAGVILRDPDLYDTSVNGTITADGALAGGAQIRGILDLGQTNIQVPSSPVGVLGDLPPVQHIGAPAAVRDTLARAGLGINGQSMTAAGGGGPAYPLDITVRAPSRIFIRGRGLDAELGGALQLTGTSQNVVPIGQFDLIRGRLSILQQRFTLTEGFAALQGGFIPFIRLQATTTARTGTVITIRIEGPATEPTVTFTSAPDLPQDEILAQLIFGRDLSSITPLQAVQLASAVATLAGRGGAGLIDNLRDGFGLDDFEITADENGTAAVRAGKYLSENVYTDLTIGADGTSEINLNIDISPSVTATGSTTSDGDSSLGIFFQRDY